MTHPAVRLADSVAPAVPLAALDPILSLAASARLELGQRFGLTAPRPVDLGPANEGLRPVLERLTAQGGRREELIELGAVRHWADTGRVLAGLDTLDAAGLLLRTLPLGAAGAVTYEPLSPQARFDPDPELPRRPRLSRLAWIRAVDEPGEEPCWVLECSTGLARLRFAADTAQALLELPPAELPHPVQVVLANVGALCEAGAEPSAGSQGDPTAWAFHDLLFHTRSRLGRHGGAHGATYRFVGRRPPPPAIREPTGEVVELGEPDRTALDHATLAQVLTARRSCRHWADRPVSHSALSSFLYHSARVEGTYPWMVPSAEATPRAQLDLVRRPYPSGGALHELEHYVAVRQGDGLEAGLYRYLGERHALERIAPYGPAVAGLFFDACRCTGQPTPPPVLLTLAARFDRMAWKYDAIAYACILKNVGVYYQTAYLVATALGLGICALGSGDADRFARVSGRPYLDEGSVGEMMLGLPLEEGR